MTYLQAKRIKFSIAFITVAIFFSGLSAGVTYLMFKDIAYFPSGLLMFILSIFTAFGFVGSGLSLTGTFDRYFDPQPR